AQIRQPAQHPPFGDADCCRQDKNKCDDEDDTDPDTVDVEGAGCIENVKSKSCLGGNEFADESADHREDDAGLQTVEYARGDRGNDDVGDDLAAVRAHDASLMDEVRLDLLDPRK